MTDWLAFAGLSVLVVLLFLFLARASQGLLPDSGDGGPARQPGVPGGEGVVDDRPEGVVDDRPEGVVDGRVEQEDGRAARVAEGPAGRRDRRPPEFGPGAMLANVLLTHGVLAALVVGGALLWDVPAGALGADVPTATTVGVGLAAGVVLSLSNEAASLAVRRAGVDPDEGLRELLAPASPLGWVLLLGGVLPVVAVAEELLFRAALVGALSVGFGVSPWLLAVASSLAFGVGHGAQGRAGVAVTSVLGFALAALFVVTGSLAAVVVAHYVVNALEFLGHEALGLGW